MAGQNALLNWETIDQNRHPAAANEIRLMRLSQLRWEVNQHHATLLMAAGTAEAWVSSSPYPSGVPTWKMALRYYPLGGSACRASPAALILILPPAQIRAACTSWNRPREQPVSCEDSHPGCRSSSGIAPKRWLLTNGIKSPLGRREVSSQTSCFSSAEDLSPPSQLQARSQPSAGKFILFPFPAQLRPVLGAKRAGGQSDSWNEKCEEKSGITSFSVHEWHLRHSVLKLYTATVTKIHA